MKGKIPKNVKFMHYRKFDAEGKVSSQGGLTVAYTDDDPDPIRFTMAVCRDGELDGSYSDNFNKETGRRIAAGRLLSRPDLVETSLKDNFKDFEAGMDDFVTTTYGYRRYRRTKITP